MGRNHLERLTKKPKPDVRPCRREMVVAAFAGHYQTDQHLEQLLDYLERTP